MKVLMNAKSTEHYRLFLQARRLPRCTVNGSVLYIPDEYASMLGLALTVTHAASEYAPPAWMFDYQRAITRMAIRKGNFCVFADCGLGKTAILLEYSRHAAQSGPVLIVSPLMVIPQTISEAKRFFGDALAMERLDSKSLQGWLNSGSGVGIVNYEAIRPELRAGKLAGLVLDESSLLKSHYGKWGTKLIDLGRGLKWKLACTGTPAPNDRIEYANHAVFMDAFPTVNSFLAKFFVNRGQTAERWELKAHALPAFYRALADWSIFLQSPSTYGWKDNAAPLPPIKVIQHDVSLTDEQNNAVRLETGHLFASDLGGIVGRSRLGQLAKGNHRGQKISSRKPAFVASMALKFAAEERSTIIWCKYNAEQDELARLLPGAGNIDGSTPLDKRPEIIADFQTGKLPILISKAKVLGFGLNLQRCTRMIFSGLEDSYESFYQAVKRANRYGATEALEAHIPVTPLEAPMVDNVLRKAAQVQHDTEEQERIFKEYGHELLCL